MKKLDNGIFGGVLILLGMGLMLVEIFRDFDFDIFLRVLFDGRFFLGGLIIIAIGGYIFNKHQSAR